MVLFQTITFCYNVITAIMSGAFDDISVFNSNPDIVMVGFRVHVGNTSASHIPSSISIFQRVIKLDEGMRSWYDIPFTVAESLLADEEFTVSVGPTFNGSTLPRIDSLEVYGRAKDEFG
ncbi:auxin transport protein BIG, partial [Trifolium medium]|nr:auxin transport protein BIG [Trifolium medium]